ncbi:hypothetical protein EKL30_10675 [Candidimonas sp. SYP-B2681]|uniref:hypothetical protein n=1 Tax=Candidimonas sp. SYP-B2681 TaxID=2497686 RepID=UPI000F87DD78|nr:hypothetical protein [Candidimonas sp. SYP-B2681]RTZ43444.1 hypothetical protein EKL30_10675 [Candidimonas sp. SYP-B2681]
MRSVVTIIFNPRQRVELAVDVEPGGAGSVAAREWFETAWSRLGCEPLRASGKVLMLDKILGVADALGYLELSKYGDLAQEFATMAAMALEKPLITVDLPGLSVGY